MAKKWQAMVKAYLENYPETRENNTTLWIRITDHICTEKGWNTKDEIFYRTLMEDLPTQHSLAAAISQVKTKHPELKADPEVENRKKEIQQQYAQEWNELINNLLNN